MKLRWCLIFCARIKPDNASPHWRDTQYFDGRLDYFNWGRQASPVIERVVFYIAADYISSFMIGVDSRQHHLGIMQADRHCRRMMPIRADARCAWMLCPSTETIGFSSNIEMSTSYYGHWHLILASRRHDALNLPWRLVSSPWLPRARWPNIFMSNGANDISDDIDAVSDEERQRRHASISFKISLINIAILTSNMLIISRLISLKKGCAPWNEIWPAMSV